MKGYNTLNSVMIGITRHNTKVLDGQIIANEFLVGAAKVWETMSSEKH